MGCLDVRQIRHNTIQCEGAWVGSPCDIVELTGCSYGCKGCDNRLTDNGSNSIEIDKLISHLESPRVMIQGGEPFSQLSMLEFIDEVLKIGKRVHIETCGAVWMNITPLLCDELWVTLSPKAHLAESAPVLSPFWTMADEIVLTISDGTEINFYEQYLSMNRLHQGFLMGCPTPVMLKPNMDIPEKSLPIVLEILKLNPNFRLNLPIDRFLGMP